MKMNIIFRIAAVFTAIILLLQFVSCESYPRKILSDEGDSEAQAVVLLKDGERRCNLAVSTNVMERLKSDKKKLLDELTPYFNIISDDLVDSNIIYINSSISRLMDGFTAYDQNTYVEAKKNLPMDVLNQLMYRDYYVFVEEKSILVVCGSATMIFEVIQTLYDEYISQGVEEKGKYIMNLPQIGIYSGNYLKGVGIAGNPIKNYTIVYPSLIYSSEGSTAAKYFYEYFYENCGVSLPMTYNDNSKKIEYEIVVGNTSKSVCRQYYSIERQLGSYRVVQSGKKLYIMGGSDWALQYAMDILIHNYFAQGLSIPENYTISGSIYGRCIFEKYAGANLRIMSQNIWGNYNNTPVWMAAGLDCSISARLKGFANVFMAYNPDVICFQEVNRSEKIIELLNMMEQKGQNYEFIDCGRSVNYTPLAYNTDTLTLVDSGEHKFEYGSDMGSKAYTWACFTHNKTRETFVVMSTHLWWMNLQQNGNSVDYRQRQLKEISDKIDKLIEEYKCPGFVLGDFNCNISSTEYKSSLENGFTDCYNIATEFADNVSGRFVCNQYFYSNQPSIGTYKKAIDHALVKNIGDSEVVSYDYITPNFFGKLSDHAPLCLDIKL